jgi:hypothetical protein
LRIHPETSVQRAERRKARPTSTRSPCNLCIPNRCVLFVKTTNFNYCICYFFKNQTMMKYVKQKSYLWLSPLSCLPVRFFMILLPVWVRVNISFKEGKTHGDMRRPSTFFVHPRAHACFSIGPLNIQSPQTC